MSRVCPLENPGERNGCPVPVDPCCPVRKPGTTGQDKNILSRPVCPVLDKN